MDASPGTAHLVPEFSHGVIEPATAAIPTPQGDGRDRYPLRELLLGTVNILTLSQRSQSFPSEGRATPQPSSLRQSLLASERRHPATMRRGFGVGSIPHPADRNTHREAPTRPQPPRGAGCSAGASTGSPGLQRSGSGPSLGRSQPREPFRYPEREVERSELLSWDRVLALFGTYFLDIRTIHLGGKTRTTDAWKARCHYAPYLRFLPRKIARRFASTPFVRIPEEQLYVSLLGTLPSQGELRRRELPWVGREWLLLDTPLVPHRWAVTRNRRDTDDQGRSAYSPVGELYYGRTAALDSAQRLVADVVQSNAESPGRWIKEAEREWR